MPVFQYTARTLKGELQSGEVDLPTRDDVIAHLRKNRMVVVQVRAAPKAFKLSLTFGGGIKTRDLVVMTRQFATMINAGLPLVQAQRPRAQQHRQALIVCDHRRHRRRPSPFAPFVQHRAGPVANRPAAAAPPGTWRSEPEVWGGALHADPRDPHLVRRHDPGLPR